jgi:phosphodiesterase/alkaline phosphatase D-like protein
MLNIAFCSCNHPSLHAQQAGWLAVAERQPDVLLLLGDNVYVEQHVGELIGHLRPVVAMSDLEYGRRLHSQYAAQWQVPQFRQALAASARVMGTLDDHDFLGNDTDVRPVFERKARLARWLHRQFIQTCNLRPLPLAYPAFEDVLAWDDLGFERGIGLAQSWQSAPGEGDAQPIVKIILLDNRSYRQAPKGQAGQQAVVLGAAQISWLAQELIGSQQLSIVASGSTFSAGDRLGIAGSPLQAYAREAAILRRLYAGQSQGRRVIHVGGDLHYNAFWPWSQEHPFWELASSGMGSGWQPFARQQRGNFGLISVSSAGVRLSLFGAEAERNLDILIQEELLR